MRRVRPGFRSGILGGASLNSDVDRMSTPQQFLESFWQEKVEAYADANVRLEAVHTKYFGEPLLKHARDFLMRDKVRTVFEVQQKAGSAVVITREPLVRDAAMRNRYHLSAVGESWKITRIDRECLHCGGTGRAGRMTCERCDGEGWYDPRKDAA
jgi:hypothetical protein